jgi:hypothetical protein
METDPTLEFEYFLAQKLGMTVARMRRELSNDEFMHWGIFYQRKAQQVELERLKGGGRG